MLGSAQNPRRLVTVYPSPFRAGLGIDLYTADVAVATGRSTIPQLGDDWSKVLAYLPPRVRVKQSGQFHRTQAAQPHRILDDHAAANPSDWVVFGANQAHIRHQLGGLLAGGAVVWTSSASSTCSAGGDRANPSEALDQFADAFGQAVMAHPDRLWWTVG